MHHTETLVSFLQVSCELTACPSVFSGLYDLWRVGSLLQQLKTRALQVCSSTESNLVCLQIRFWKKTWESGVLGEVSCWTFLYRLSPLDVVCIDMPNHHAWALNIVCFLLVYCTSVKESGIGFYNCCQVLRLIFIILSQIKMCTSCAFPNLGKYNFLAEGQISGPSHFRLTSLCTVCHGPGLEVLVNYAREYIRW